MIALLTEQCELYEQLAALSASQHALITGDKPERLLGVLGDRQRLLDRVEALAARMRPYQTCWAEMRLTVPSAEAKEVDRLLSRANKLLAGILELDKADAQLLAARKSATAQEMSVVKAGRTAGAAYVAAAYGSAEKRDWTDR